jgi:photosystem II stability/assembly factor-like uncharacterized protein
MVPMFRFKLPGIIIAVVLMLTLGQLTEPVSAGDDVWTTSSLAGFSVATIAIDPTNSEIVYVGTSHGMLVSQDGGQNWRGVPSLIGEIRSILVHAENTSVLFVTDSYQLLRSEDGGSNWSTLGNGMLNWPTWVGAHPLQPDTIYVQTNNGFFRSPDGGNSWSGAGLPVVGQVQAVAFDPTNGDVMYVALARRQGLFRTGDGGRSWSLISGTLEGQGSVIYRMNVDTNGTLFVQSQAGIYKSADGGQSWQLDDMEENIRRYGSYAERSGFAVDTTQPDILYHGGDRGLFRSRDGGTTWEQFADVLPGWPDILVADPRQEGHLYAIATAQSTRQLHKSTNGGATWHTFHFGATVQKVAAHSEASGIVFGLSAGRGVGPWRGEGSLQSWKPSNAGLEEVQVNIITFDPTDTNIVYAGTQAGLYRSIDGGNTWTLTGLPTNVQVFTVVIDPQTNTNLYVGGSTGLLRSSNNGESWTAAAAVSQNVTSMAINREAPETMYAVANGRLHRSQDSGESWSVLNHPSQQIASVALKPDDPRTIYTGGRDGAYVSRDGGAGWSRMAIQASSSSNLAPLLRTDPRRPDALYLAWGAEFFISPDTGVTWFPLSQGTPGLAINDLAVDAGDPLTLYATFQNGVGSVWRYTLTSLPEPPTPTPSATNTPLPLPTNTATPTATPLSILSVTATARAVESADPEATAVALFGLEREGDAGEVAPDSEEAATVSVEETGSIWRIMGWVLLLGIIAGGGFFVWRYAQTTAPVASPAQVFCPECGTSIPAQARFCIKCGHPMGQ